MTNGTTLEPTAQKRPPTEPQPSLECFERLADAEGVMELANDPTWRTKALQELSHMRANSADHRVKTDAALAENRRSRDALEAEFERGNMAVDDLNSTRSELEF